MQILKPLLKKGKKKTVRPVTAPLDLPGHPSSDANSKDPYPAAIDTNQTAQAAKASSETITAS